MPRHPDILPGQHDDGDAENGRVEKLLSGPADRVRDRAREGREKGRAGNPCSNTQPYPTATAQHAMGGGEDDADDQSGFDGLPEDDDESADHLLATPL